MLNIHPSNRREAPVLATKVPLTRLMSVGETLIPLAGVCRLGEPLVTPLGHIMGSMVENRSKKARMEEDDEVKSLRCCPGDIRWLTVIPAPATHFPSP